MNQKDIELIDGELEETADEQAPKIRNMKGKDKAIALNQAMVKG